MKELITIRQARKTLKEGSEADKEKVKQELEAIAGSEITDVLQWTQDGQVKMKSSNEISHRARKGIKKIRATPNRFGTALEVEMHDKMSALRLLAKHHGMLEEQENDNRPSVIGINIKGPEIKDVTIKKEKNNDE